MITTARPSSSPSSSLASIDRDRRQAQLALADRGLGAYPLAGRERRLEQVVGERPGGLALERRVVGTLDLALDLVLADDHRLEPGGHAVEVTGGVAVAVRVDRGRQLGRPDARRLASIASTVLSASTGSPTTR